MLVVFITTLSAALVAAAAPEASGYAYYAMGDLEAPTPARTETGLMLMGGGDWVDAGVPLVRGRAGHGHIVILRASGTDDLQKEFYRRTSAASPRWRRWCSAAATAASDPRVLRIIRRADGIFLGGGDQSNYVRYWKGTPLNKALDEHVRSGKPIGGIERRPCDTRRLQLWRARWRQPRLGEGTEGSAGPRRHAGAGFPASALSRARHHRQPFRQA